jgi:hypothetical protein
VGSLVLAACGEENGIESSGEQGAEVTEAFEQALVG